jgi:hypothetical protein
MMIQYEKLNEHTKLPIGKAFDNKTNINKMSVMLRQFDIFTSNDTADIYSHYHQPVPTR